MIAASARVNYPEKLLVATKASFAKINDFTHDQLCNLTNYLATIRLDNLENGKTKQAQLVQFLVLHLEEIYEK